MSVIKAKQDWEDARYQNSSVDAETRRKGCCNFKNLCVIVLAATCLFLRAIPEGIMGRIN